MLKLKFRNYISELNVKLNLNTFKYTNLFEYCPEVYEYEFSDV